MSNTTTIDLSEVELLYQFRVVIFGNFAAAMVAAYDIFLTFPDELDLVWTRKWRWVNLLFFVNRYLAPIQAALSIVSWLDPNAPYNVLENINLFATTWVAPVVVTIVEALLIIRVCALYHNSTFVRALLWTLLATYFAASLGLSIVISQNIQTLPSPLPSVLGSDASGAPIVFNLLPAIWSISLLTETTLVCLTIGKTYSHVRASPKGTPVLALILRDGCLYFVVIFFLMLANAVCYRLQDSESFSGYTSFFQEPELCISSVLCSRLFLNLRAQLYRPQINFSTMFDNRPKTEDIEAIELIDVSRNESIENEGNEAGGSELTG